MASAEEMKAIKSARVLMVGAGGIGCELLKTLVMTGFVDIELIDLDTIDVSNLNRQFLFRKRHVGQSKAKVARDAVLKFRPEAKITAHHGNVKSPAFGVEFVRRFSVVLSGLDNLDARRHVNRVCLAAAVPLVESGTTGYNGQVDVHLKGLTECYECKPKPVPKSYPTCTITNTPSKPVHCIVWAKELPFQKLFGDPGQANDLDIRTDDMDTASEEDERKFFQHRPEETSTQFARRIFDRVFGLNVARTLEMDDLWKNRRKPVPLYIDEILPSETSEGGGGPGQANGRSTPGVAGTGLDRQGGEAELGKVGNGLEGVAAGDEREGKESAGGGGGGHALSAMARLGLKNPQEVWSLQMTARVFVESVSLFMETRQAEIGRLSFDKDDQLAVEFVAAAANLRSHSFGIPPLSLFDAKGVAGNIVHAIATTNAIVAGLIVLEAVKVVTGRLPQSRNVWCNEFPMGRGLLVMPEERHPPNPKCYVCSETPLLLEVNTRSATLGEVMEKVVRKRLSVGSPMVMVGNSLLYETGDDLEEDEVERYEANLGKRLSDFAVPIASGAVLAVEDYQQHFKCSLHIKHRDEFDEEKEPEGMVLHGEVPTTSVGGAETQSTEAKDDSNDDEIVIAPLVELGGGKRKRDRGDVTDGNGVGEKRTRVEGVTAEPADVVVL